MSEKHAGTQDRREFFKTWGRYVALGLLGLGGVRARRGRVIRPENHRCVNKSVCCHCPVFGDCGLPAAVTAKRAGADAGNAGDRHDGRRQDATAGRRRTHG